ncbi:MAG TPA: hypothetical protein VFG98_13585 [Intrasporangium sp.]|nr:hypothetical protein [Intrasporangium sp.]
MSHADAAAYAAGDAESLFGVDVVVVIVGPHVELDPVESAERDGRCSGFRPPG